MPYEPREKNPIVKKVSMKSIAAACGHSPSTVARVLNGTSYSSRDTRETVLAIARSLGYRHFSGQSKLLWGVIFENGNIGIGNYDNLLLNSLLMKIQGIGDECIFIPDTQLHLLDRIPCDGILSVFYNPEKEKKLLADYSLPMVVINEYSLHSEGIWSVTSDEYDAIYRAFSFFQSKGHSKIGILSRLKDKNYSMKHRDMAFREIIRRYGGTQSGIFSWDPDISLPHAEAKKIRDDGITALLAPMEMGMAQLVELAARLGCKIPGDISLIAWENSESSAFFHPPVTTFSQDYKTLAHEAVELLRKLYHRQFTGLCNIKVPYLFHERDSIRNLLK